MLRRLRRDPRWRRALLPVWRALTWNARRLRWAGRRLQCPVCGTRARAFLPYGLQVREQAMCPVCESMERHRLYWVFYRDRTDLLTRPQRMLHLAPEMGLDARLRRVRGLRRVTADLLSDTVGVRSDLQRLAFGDGSFDVLHCSHVLEHVPDDRAALRELRRVLRPDGWALIQVPIWSDGETREDPSVTEAADRERLYGQHDHVRIYGRDVVGRIEAAGFDVEILPATELGTAAQLARWSIPADEEVFRCRPAAAAAG